MLFVISPAKTLDFDTPPPADHHTLPRFVERSAALIEVLRQKTPADIASLMDVSEPLAALNVSRYQSWQPQFTPSNSKQAIFAFMGDVYEGLDAKSLDAASLARAQDRLRILSGLYGVLRPLDRMQPYRLEMGTRLPNPGGRNLYDFWGDALTESLNTELAAFAQPALVNLASEEYFKAVKRKKLQARLVDCVFEDFKGGRYKIISFYAKRARGLMARYALLNRLDTPEDLRHFDVEGYRFAPEVSDEHRYVFRRDAVPA